MEFVPVVIVVALVEVSSVVVEVLLEASVSSSLGFPLGLFDIDVPSELLGFVQFKSLIEGRLLVEFNEGESF